MASRRTKDYPEHIRRAIDRSMSGYQEMLAGTDKAEAKRINAIKEIIKFLEDQRGHFERL